MSASFEGLDAPQAHTAKEFLGLGFAGEFLASDGGLELARAFLALSPPHRKALVAAGRALAEACSFRVPSDRCSRGMVAQIPWGWLSTLTGRTAGPHCR